MRCLKIEDKWVNLILNGTKTWEIRRRNTKIRERIALGNTKTKRVVGYATIIDSVEMTVEELKKHNDKHQANDFSDEYANEKKTLFAWILSDVEVEPNPKHYSYSTGSWCRVKTRYPGQMG
jgi:predicted transcriptional regulator